MPRLPGLVASKWNLLAKNDQITKWIGLKSEKFRSSIHFNQCRLWWRILWLYRFPLVVNLTSQISHWKRFSVQCDDVMCRFTVALFAYLFSHMVQLALPSVVSFGGYAFMASSIHANFISIVRFRSQTSSTPSTPGSTGTNFFMSVFLWPETWWRDDSRMPHSVSPWRSCHDLHTL